MTLFFNISDGLFWHSEWHFSLFLSICNGHCLVCCSCSYNEFLFLGKAQSCKFCRFLYSASHHTKMRREILLLKFLLSCSWVLPANSPMINCTFAQAKQNCILLGFLRIYSFQFIKLWKVNFENEKARN